MSSTAPSGAPSTQCDLADVADVTGMNAEQLLVAPSTQLYLIALATIAERRIAESADEARRELERVTANQRNGLMSVVHKWSLTGRFRTTHAQPVRRPRSRGRRSRVSTQRRTRATSRSSGRRSADDPPAAGNSSRAVR